MLLAPPDASFVDVADLEGDARREILVGDARGLALLPASPAGWGAPRRLLDVAGLALLPDPDELPFLDLARDWDGDGKDEILLPLPDRVAVITRGADGWARLADLQLPPRSDYTVRREASEPRSRNYTFRVALTVPELVRGDWDGDGRADLIALLDDTVTVFRARATGLFEPAPATRFQVGARTEAESARGNSSLHTTVLDLDGDGVADLAVNKVSGGMGSMRAEIAIHPGRRGGGWGKPSQTLGTEGWAGAVLFGDLDGDKRPELVQAHTGAGFAEVVRIILTRRLAVGFAVHKNLGAKGLSARPAIDLPLDFPVDYSAGAELDGPFPTLDGDFNGDGRADLAGPKGDGAFGVWLGGKALLDEYPKAIVHVPLSRFWRVADLDGDRRADVVVFHRFRPEREGRITVLRNTGRGW